MSSHGIIRISVTMLITALLFSLPSMALAQDPIAPAAPVKPAAACIAVMSAIVTGVDASAGASAARIVSRFTEARVSGRRDRHAVL